MPKLTLIRGLPGSGKSTMAKAMKGFIHLEADMWHVNGEGVYDFDPDHVRTGHIWCQNTCLTFLRNGIDVVVSNTFTTQREIAPYLAMKDFCKDLDIKIIEATGNYGNIHNVPADVIERMKARWEKI